MSQTPSDWYTFHGDTERSGYVSSSGITTANVSQLKTLHTLELGGPILSTPAIVEGDSSMSARPNGARVDGELSPNGGSLHKIDLETGVIVASYSWLTDRAEGDTHGFTGMGCTPTVVDGRVYFSAFNGRLYCLDANTLTVIWVTDLRVADLGHNQPVSNITHDDQPQAEGWCSPLVVDGKVYVGMGEGENPAPLWLRLLSRSGHGKRDLDLLHEPVRGRQRQQAQRSSWQHGHASFAERLYSLWRLRAVLLSEYRGEGLCRAVGWAPDKGLNRIFCAAGNPGPETDCQGNPGPPNFSGYAYSVLSLDADSGELKGVVQVPP